MLTEITVLDRKKLFSDSKSLFSHLWSQLDPISADDINSIPTELDQLYKSSESMDAYITKLEKQIALIQSDIANIDKEINNDFHYDAKDLEKYASAKVDVAEKETYKGIVYDLDIYDHSKKLNQKR